MLFIEIYKGDGDGETYPSGENRGLGISYNSMLPINDLFEFIVTQSCIFEEYTFDETLEDAWGCGIQLKLKIKDLDMVSNGEYYQPTMFFLDA